MQDKLSQDRCRMECSSPPPLTDDQLSAALDQTAVPDVIDHLASCASCAERLAAAQQAEQSLRSALYRWDCPAPQTLADYHLGRPSAEEQRHSRRSWSTRASRRRHWTIAARPPLHAENQDRLATVRFPHPAPAKWERGRS